MVNLAPPHTSLPTLKGGLPLASRDGVETRGPVGAAGGGAGAAEGGAGGAGAFAEGAGAVAGGADAVAGAPDGVVDGVGGAVASLDCRKMCSLTKNRRHRLIHAVADGGNAVEIFQNLLAGGNKAVHGVEEQNGEECDREEPY